VHVDAAARDRALLAASAAFPPRDFAAFRAAAAAPRRSLAASARPASRALRFATRHIAAVFGDPHGAHGGIAATRASA